MQPKSKKSPLSLVTFLLSAPLASAVIGGCTVATIAGGPGTPRGNVDGVGTNARFNLPVGIAVASGDIALLVSDSVNHNVRSVVLPAGSGAASLYTVSTPLSLETDPDGQGGNAFGPNEVAVAPGSGLVYVVNTTDVIRVNLALPPGDPNRRVSVAAGLHTPSGVAVDAAGNVFVSDSDSNCIRRVAAAVATGPGSRAPAPVFAGSCNRTRVNPDQGGSPLAGQGAVDGAATVARFNEPFGLAVDNVRGLLIVADANNNCVRTVRLADGFTTTLAGDIRIAPTPNNPNSNAGATDGIGAAATFSTPTAVAVDPATGNVFVADMVNNNIRIITPAGNVSTIAGGGPLASGWADGAGAQARFFFPLGIVAVPSLGALFVADSDNHVIRQIVCPAIFPPAGPAPPPASGGGAAAAAADVFGPFVVGNLSAGMLAIIVVSAVVALGAGAAVAVRMRRPASSSGGGVSDWRQGSKRAAAPAAPAAVVTA